MKVSPFEPLDPFVDSDLLIDTMPDGLIVLDAGCRVRRWNKSMEKLAGYSESDMLGKPCALLDFRDPYSQKRLNSEQQCLSDGQPNKARLKEIDCTLQTKYGDTVPVRKIGRVLRDSEGFPIGILEILTDLRPLRQLEEKILALESSCSREGLGRLVGDSHALQEVYKRIKLSSDSDVTVLVEGETGTGKELVAEAIHDMSSRKGHALVKVNCSALSESLLESELFGHVKGAFTGAIKDKVGRIEMAEGGTLFLDEIGDLSPLIQLKLLRVLQEHEYERVGESIPRKADVRFIAATHRNLKKRVKDGEFREDFYYRIRVFSIIVPPLRDHKNDIPLLRDTFVRKLNLSMGKHITRVSDSVNYCFMDYCWPGNVRELENAVEHAFVTCRGDCLHLSDLPLEIRSPEYRGVECQGRTVSSSMSVLHSEPLTREKMLEVLEACKWNRSEVARRLGVDRTTIWRNIKKWDIAKP
ncbi:MAG: sigma 54-interacting transcriptional regulator [Kiritimatiellae bacterium]|nr:sigma 54-interacting transcriptional regulator [Kiritimatiellia bacterium]